MKKYLFLIPILILLFVADSFGACTAGSMTTTPLALSKNLLTIQLDITSDASGDVSGTSECQIKVNQGYISVVEVLPDTGGTLPTAGYDCRFNTPLGNDIMQGSLQDLPQVNTVDSGVYSPLVGGATMASPAYSTLDVVCSNMGNAKGTTMNVVIYKE